MIRLILFVFIFYLACAPAVENCRLRESLRIAKANLICVPVPHKYPRTGLLRKK